MDIELAFAQPRDVSAPGLDGLVLRFPFSVTRIGEGALRDEIANHSASVSISGTLLSIWGFDRHGGNKDALTKTLFQFAIERVVRAVREGADLDELGNIDLATDSAPDSNPFDPSKIPYPSDFSVKLRSEKQPSPVAESTSLGFVAARSVPIELEESLARFRQDHPNPDAVAFVMMPFADSAVHADILKAIRETLDSFGIEGLRADDRDYHDDVLNNIVTYMYGCSLGIAVFEQIDTDNFNPNVSLEVGYMLGLRKPVCLLKESGLPSLHTDLVGKLYKTFDHNDPEGTIVSDLSKWVVDHHLGPSTK